MKKIGIKIILIVLSTNVAYAASAPWIGNMLNGLPCNGHGQGVGPFDYTQRTNLKKEQDIVEINHFTSNVENLIQGKTNSNPFGDLDYTLRAFPNHHRALLSIIRFQLNIKNDLAEHKIDVPPECYLQRAINFNPTDSVPYSLYGYYLHKMGYLEKAVKYYEKALELDPANAKFAYSFSLLLIDLKRYDEALKYGKIAYQRKDTPQGLRKKLQQLGVWAK